MFSTSVIPTVGRPTLSRAVESVLSQSLDEDFEVVVVNDSGRPLEDAAWRESPRVRVIDTNRRERSVARNAGAAVARGRHLHFLDDDDWLVPGGLQYLARAARDGGTDWVYGHTLLVDGDGAPILALRPRHAGNCFVQAMSGEWTPLQASLVRAETFFAVGGFHPLIAGPEDVDLLRRVCLVGAVAFTPEIVACIGWRTEATRTDYARHAARSRWAREQILGRPGVLRRLRDSANSSYWHGRIVRAYATSMAWNLRRGHVLTAASRAAFAATSLLLAGPHALAPAFVRAVARPHASEAFAEGARDAARRAEAQP